jgi:hypothetical protein
MAQGKKISELTEVSSVTDNDEFLFVDKEGSGANSGQGGSNVKIKFSDLKMAITDGMKGEPGMDAEKGQKGEVGDRGIDGGGAAYFDQSPTDGDSIYYMGSGNLGLGTDAPTKKLTIKGDVAVIDSISESQMSISNNKLQVQTPGVGYEDLLLNPSGGNVGIGTPSPDHLLELNKNGGDVDLAFHDAGAIKYTMGIKDGSQSFQIAEGGVLSPSNPTAVSATRFLIDTNGNVGIGKDEPIVPLHIKGNVVTEEQMLGGSGAGTLILETKETQPEAGDVGRLTIGTLPYRQNSNGNWLEGNSFISARTADLLLQPASHPGYSRVGIGGTLPKNKLHVVSDSDDSVVAKFTRPFAEGATANETTNYESYVSVQAGYVDDVWGEQSTVRIGAKRSATSNEASLVLQTVGAGRSTGDKLVDRMYIANGYGHTYIYGEMNNDSLNLNIDGTTSLLNLVNREPVVDETSVNPVGITFKSAHSDDATKPITTRAAIYATREASPGTPSAVSGRLHFAVNNHGSQLSDAMVIAPHGGVYFENSIVVRRSFADDPVAATNSAILNVVNSTVSDNHKSEFIVLGNGNIQQGGPQQTFNANGPSTNNTASSVMWSQKLNVPPTTTAGTGGYTHYTLNIGNYVYGKFTIMAARTNGSANYAFAEYIVSNNNGVLHGTALNEKLIGGNVEIQITQLNNNQTGLNSNQCQFKIAMKQEGSGGSITVFYQGSSSLASTDHDHSHTNW